MKKSFLAVVALLLLAGVGCKNAGTQLPAANNTQQNTTTEQQSQTPEIKKADTSDWTSDYFEEITFKYPANLKRINSTNPDAKLIVLWTPDNKDYIQIEKETNLKWCNKSACRSQSDLSPISAQEWFEHFSKSDTHYTVRLQDIDGHKTAIIVAKNTATVTVDSYSQDARRHNAMILNGNSIFNISLTTSDDKTALIADFYTLLDTVRFVK